jgi:predicted amidohydrolase
MRAEHDARQRIASEIRTAFLHNLLLAVDASGDTYGNYREAHIFVTETRVFDAGNQLRHIDVEFPASARTLAVPLGQDGPGFRRLSPAASP